MTAADVKDQLVIALRHAHDMEVLGLRLLRAATSVAGDGEIAAIYDAHLLETVEHERRIAERLAAHDRPLPSAPVPLDAEVIAPRSETPITLAATAYAFECHEVATYRLLCDLARRAGDRETIAAAQEILEQEQRTVALVAGTFERAVDVALGEPPAGPVSSRPSP